MNKNVKENLNNHITISEIEKNIEESEEEIKEGKIYKAREVLKELNEKYVIYY